MLNVQINNYFAAILYCLMPVMGGCTPALQLILVNGSNQTLQVTTKIDYQDSKPDVIDTVELAANSQKKCRLITAAQMIVSVKTGERWYKLNNLFEQIADPQHIYVVHGYYSFTTWILLLREGAYRIPLQYQADWQSHIAEIKASPLHIEAVVESPQDAIGD